MPSNSIWYTSLLAADRPHWLVRISLGRAAFDLRPATAQLKGRSRAPRDWQSYCYLCATLLPCAVFEASWAFTV
jgi:hypothetical protein